MANVLLWGYQCTVDYTYQLGKELTSIFGELIQKKIFPELSTEFERIMHQGLNGLDETITLDNAKYDPDGLAAEKLKMLRLFLNERKFNCYVQIGGNPAISAVRGYLLRQGPDETELPLAYYAGLLPKSVEGELGLSFPELREAFHIQQSCNAHPQTVGLETPDAKLMLIYGPGRSIADLAPEGSFKPYLQLIQGVLAGIGRGKAVLALNVPSMKTVSLSGNEETELAVVTRMLREIRATFGDKMLIFMSTRKIDSNAYACGALEFLKQADMVSMSEDEADKLHTASRGGIHDAEPLAYKVRELPFKAIKVCHSAYGAVMDLGCRPERIVTSNRFRKDPAAFLEEVLRLSADGATYAKDATAGLGRSANEAMIRIYSTNVGASSRQTEKFNATFLDSTEPLPAGMLSIASPRVIRTLGAVVGLGAIFDGLLLSFLMRD